eukprot:6635649-Pyramimonas_sp.AAC.1
MRERNPARPSQPRASWPRGEALSVSREPGAAGGDVYRPQRLDVLVCFVGATIGVSLQNFSSSKQKTSSQRGHG